MALTDRLQPPHALVHVDDMVSVFEPTDVLLDQRVGEDRRNITFVALVLVDGAHGLAEASSRADMVLLPVGGLENEHFARTVLLEFFTGTLGSRSARGLPAAAGQLLEASRDNAVTAEKKTEIATMFTRLEAHEAELDSTIDSLKADVIDAQAGEMQAAERADGARTMELAIALVGSISAGLIAAVSFNKGAVVLGIIKSITQLEAPESEDDTKELLLPSDARTTALAIARPCSGI